MKNSSIYELIINICHSIDGSKEQQKLLNQLSRITAKELNKIKQGTYSEKSEVINSTLIIICGINKHHHNINAHHLKKFLAKFKHLSKSDLEKTYFNHAKKIFSNRLKDIYRSYQRKTHPVSLDNTINKNNSTTYLDIQIGSKITGIEKLLEQEKTFNLQNFSNYLKQDPDHHLKSCHSHKYQQLNAYNLVLKFYYEHQTWKEISKQLNINIGTVTAHFYRRCKPLLRELASYFDIAS